MASDVAEASRCGHLLLPSRAQSLPNGTYIYRSRVSLAAGNRQSAEITGGNRNARSVVSCKVIDIIS